MAVCSWIAVLPGGTSPQALEARIAGLGLQVLADCSNTCQLCAQDPADAALPLVQRVKVLVALPSHPGGDCEVEVRSAEPLRGSPTRCQRIADQLQGFMPAAA